MSESKELRKKDKPSKVFCETRTDTEISTVSPLKPSVNTDREENQSELRYILWNRSMKYVYTSFINAITSSVKPNGHLDW